MLILQGDLQALQNLFPETYRNIMSCRHHRDNRTPLEYAQDLVASWLVEDSFLEVLNSNGLRATLDGADRNRRILANVKTSASSDFTVSYNGNSRKLELMNDYTGYWSRKGQLDLRDSKYQSLTAEQSLFLVVSTATREFALYDFSEEIPARFLPSHIPYGRKPAYQISNTNDMMYEATSYNITQAVKRHL